MTFNKGDIILNFYRNIAYKLSFDGEFRAFAVDLMSRCRLATEKEAEIFLSKNKKIVPLKEIFEAEKGRSKWHYFNNVEITFKPSESLLFAVRDLKTGNEVKTESEAINYLASYYNNNKNSDKINIEDYNKLKRENERLKNKLNKIRLVLS